MLGRAFKSVGSGSRWFLHLFLAVAVFACFDSAISVRAHEDTLIRIGKIDETIKLEGVSAELLYLRAELYEEHREWDRSLADYLRALREDPRLSSAHLGAARCYLRKRKADRGLEEIELFLASSEGSGDHDGLLVRARLLALAGQLVNASKGYRDALAKLPGAPHRVEIYFEWASELKRGGREFNSDALQVVDAGLEELGENTTLLELAVGLELEAGDYLGALARVDTLLSGALKDSPRWSFQRAEILEALQKSSEALDAYQHLVERIHSMPIRRRNVTAIREIEESASRKIAELASR
jgi:tetratricopeptide (TPR) repeat protein